MSKENENQRFHADNPDIDTFHIKPRHIFNRCLNAVLDRVAGLWDAVAIAHNHRKFRMYLPAHQLNFDTF